MKMILHVTMQNCSGGVSNSLKELFDFNSFSYIPGKNVNHSQVLNIRWNSVPYYCFKQTYIWYEDKKSDSRQIVTMY